MNQAAAKKSDLRSDPKPRHIDGATPWTRLKNRDKNRHYVLANENNNGEYDVGYYLCLAEGLADLGVGPKDGYVVESQREGGPVFVAGSTSRKTGDPIRFRGMVLMSCPMAFKELIDQVGEDGTGGRQAADERDKLTNRRGAVDIAGIRRKGVALRKTTEQEWMEE